MALKNYYAYYASQKNIRQEKIRKTVNRLIYPMGLSGPIFALPQALKIWTEKSAANISLVSWIAMMIPSIIWVIYGLSNNQKPVAITNTAWIFVYLAIISGAILYM